MLDSQVSLVNRSQDVEKKKKEHSRIWAWSQRNAMALRPALILQKYVQYIHCYLALQYCTWSVVLRPLFIFLVIKRAANDPVWGWLLKRPLFCFFWKNGLICTLFSLIARRRVCRFVFRSGSLDIVGGEASLTIHDETSNRYSSGLIQHLYRYPYIRDE